MLSSPSPSDQSRSDNQQPKHLIQPGAATSESKNEQSGDTESDLKQSNQGDQPLGPQMKETANEPSNILELLSTKMHNRQLIFLVDQSQPPQCYAVLNNHLPWTVVHVCSTLHRLHWPEPEFHVYYCHVNKCWSMISN